MIWRTLTFQKMQSVFTSPALNLTSHEVLEHDIALFGCGRACRAKAPTF